MVNKQEKRERFNVTLQPSVVKLAQQKMMGSKLSPLINNLLKIWIKHRKEIERIMEEDNQ